jgi:hypothetical protein
MPYRTTKRGEIQQLQYEVGREISRDAPEISKGVFGDNSMHPDMATVSNAELDTLYRQKYLSNDRKWLQGEARRDPEQFMAVAKRIGVELPPSERMDGELPSAPRPNALPQALAQNAAAPGMVLPTLPTAGMGGIGPQPPPMPAALPAAPAAPAPQLWLPGMP